MSKRASLATSASETLTRFGDIVLESYYVHVASTIVAGGQNVITEKREQIRYVILEESSRPNDESDDVETNWLKILFLRGELSLAPKKNDVMIHADCRYRVEKFKIDPAGVTVIADVQL